MAVTCTAILAGALIAYGTLHANDETAAAAKPYTDVAQVKGTSSHQTTGVADASSTYQVSSPLPAGNQNFQKAFLDARNIRTFIEEALPAAKSGDSEAQYYVWKAARYCSDREKVFFRRGGKPIDLDEALVLAAKRQVPQQYVQQAFDKCHEFYVNSATGDADGWLEAAAKAGQPNAQATVALELLSSRRAREIEKVTHEAIPNLSLSFTDMGSPEELLQAAVKSRSPEVMARISDAVMLLNGESESSDIDRLAWLLVACERGYDCTSNAEWVMFSCGYSPLCMSYTDASSLVMSWAGNNWHRVQHRATELNERIDAGQWTKLGIGT
jgi:hypothetical protein